MSEIGDDDFVQITSDVIRAKILHVLKLYPRLSMSMLQVGIGTAIPPKIWHPIFDQLKEEGKVKVEVIADRSPAGRDQTYQVISVVSEED